MLTALLLALAPAAPMASAPAAVPLSTRALLRGSVPASILGPTHGGTFPPPPPIDSGGDGLPGSGLGPGGVLGPNPANPLSPSTNSQQTIGPLHWSYWWNLERDRFLWPTDRLRRPPMARDGDGKRAPRPQLPSNEATLVGVLPVLLSTLAKEKTRDIQTATLIALGRIGSRAGAPRRAAIVSAIQGRLTSSAQEISETAVLSLGILGHESAAAPLLAILGNTEEGRELMGTERVRMRTQAFAAFGLGLLADQVASPGLHQSIALGLMDALESEETHKDVHLAALIALGLCPVPMTPHVPSADLRRHRNIESAVSRSGQISWLVRRLTGPAAPTHSSAAQAHGFVALGRLANGAWSGSRAKAMDALMDAATSKSSDKHVRAAAWIGLGRVATASSEPGDKAALKALAKGMLLGQPVERRFAAISLAQAASRAPADGERFDGYASPPRALLLRLGTAPSQDEPWIAMALAINAHALHHAGVHDADAAARALADRLRKERGTSQIGAFAMAVALSHVGVEERQADLSKSLLMEKFKQTQDPAARGQIALALGMLGTLEARQDLQDLLRNSRFEPELLWSSAVALWLLEEPTLTDLLIRTLVDADAASTRAAAAAALGRVGNERAVAPLLELIQDGKASAAARTFGIVGLGILCDDNRRPWKTPVAHAMPYFAVTQTLQGEGTGLLDIL